MTFLPRLHFLAPHFPLPSPYSRSQAIFCMVSCKYNTVNKNTEISKKNKKERMNYCGIQQNGVASREEMKNFVTFATCDSTTTSTDRKESVVCPKPRRVGLNSSVSDHSRPLRWHVGHQAELADARAGSELLDIILSKGSNGAERLSTQVPSSPPFFCGSPPSRVSNPLIQDARFREEKQLIPSFSPLPGSPIPATPGSASSPGSSTRKGGCVRANFGHNPAVRVEGFDCLDRDRRNCSIPALA